MADKFQDIADAADAISKLCRKQKDTVGWWSEFGESFQHFNELILATPPGKQEHVHAATEAMEKKSIEFRAAKART